MEGWEGDGSPCQLLPCVDCKGWGAAAAEAEDGLVQGTVSREEEEVVVVVMVT